jgi:hypothetical protein
LRETLRETFYVGAGRSRRCGAPPSPLPFVYKEMNVTRFYVRSLLNPGRRVTNIDAATVWFAIAIVTIVLLAILCNIRQWTVAQPVVPTRHGPNFSTPLRRKDI